MEKDTVKNVITVGEGEDVFRILNRSRSKDYLTRREVGVLDAGNGCLFRTSVWFGGRVVENLVLVPGIRLEEGKDGMLWLKTGTRL